MTAVPALLTAPAKAVYDRTVRPLLPRKLAVCNGVVTPRAKLFDNTDEFPVYEQRLLESVSAYTRRGATVVDVGGGFGVAATVAAWNTGAPADELFGESPVRVFEASRGQVDMIDRTARLNGVADLVNVEHAVVGAANDIWGSTQGARHVSPAELPDADVLIVDIEGAEVDFFRAYQIERHAPDAAIVEIHSHRIDKPVEWFTDQWEAAGYRVGAVSEVDKSNHVLILVALDPSVFDEEVTHAWEQDSVGWEAQKWPALDREDWPTEEREQPVSKPTPWRSCERCDGEMQPDVYRGAALCDACLIGSSQEGGADA